MDQQIINLYDEYTHKPLSRNEFLRRLALLAGGTAAAMTLLPLLEVNYANAAVTTQEDLFTERISYPGINGDMQAYVARPKEEKAYAAVVVIHENRGLNPHIKDVARRMAVEGFVVLAPDFLAGLGGTPSDADKAKDMIGTLTPDGIVATSKAALAALKALPDTNGKAGAMGFCWGGGAVNQLAVNDEGLSAGVAYYGSQPDNADVPKIKAPLLLQYGGLDERINAGIPAFETALKAAGKTFELYKYEGANHAFNNDTNAARYDKEAADLAWGRSVAFLKKYAG